MRDPKISDSVNASLAQDINNTYHSLKPFIDAAKNESIEELNKWKRDKYDQQFAKYIHRYFLNQKAKGKVSLDENVYKDLNFMTNKYIELMGTVEFNRYLQDTINTKHRLD